MNIGIVRMCWRTAAAGAFLSLAVLAAPPIAALRIDIENYVPYHYEAFDPLNFASVTDLTVAPAAVPFGQFLMIGDIVAVNGTPVKGAFVLKATNVFLTPTVGVQPPNQPPQARQAIGDVQRGNVVSIVWDVLDTDGNPIGSITASGLTRGPRAPGALTDVIQDVLTITGGTGAFFGIRGQAGIIDMGSPRQATVEEAPADRRMLGGAKRSYHLQIIPLATPEVALTQSGPAVVHASDFTLVSAAHPAKAGETLTIFAQGLGPARAGVALGAAFPQGPSPVAAPVEVLVNGSSAQVSYAGGYAGSTDGYQINVVLPAGLPAGMGEVKIRAAWVEGAAVLIPIG